MKVNECDRVPVKLYLRAMKYELLVFTKYSSSFGLVNCSNTQRESVLC